MTMSPTRAAGRLPMSTVGSPGDTIGPPTWGTTPVTIGQTCMSVSRAAGIPIGVRRVRAKDFGSIASSLLFGAWHDEGKLAAVRHAISQTDASGLFVPRCRASGDTRQQWQVPASPSGRCNPASDRPSPVPERLNPRSGRSTSPCARFSRGSGRSRSILPSPVSSTEVSVKWVLPSVFLREPSYCCLEPSARSLGASDRSLEPSK